MAANPLARLPGTGDAGFALRLARARSANKCLQNFRSDVSVSGDGNNQGASRVQPAREAVLSPPPDRRRTAPVAGDGERKAIETFFTQDETEAVSLGRMGLSPPEVGGRLGDTDLDTEDVAQRRC